MNILTWLNFWLVFESVNTKTLSLLRTVYPEVPPLLDAQVVGWQSSSSVQIPNLMIHCFSNPDKNTPLQVVQSLTLSWHHGFGLHTPKNWEQQAPPTVVDSVGVFVAVMVAFSQVMLLFASRGYQCHFSLCKVHKLLGAYPLVDRDDGAVQSSLYKVFRSYRMSLYSAIRSFCKRGRVLLAIRKDHLLEP